MTKFVREPREILKNYRNTEPFLLVFFRGLCLTILLAILFIYFAILMFFVATDQPILSKVLVPKPYILAPVVKISSKYEFSTTCEFNYLDLRTPTDEDRANCNKYIVPTECKEQDPNNTFVGHCVGLFNPPIQDKFNFSLPDKRFGISFLITITDAAYNAADDNGMQVRVYDQLFNPSQLSDSVRETISYLDPYFLDRLEDLNFHVMGYHQVNKMYISRKTKRFQIPTFFSVLGIPPTYFPQPFIESNYESVQVPGVVSSFAKNTYGSLFVGTLDWTEEIQTELRSSNVLDSFALLAAFYGLLVGVYVCLFGWSAILPWGICQITCCKRKSKSNLREKFPRGIPVISPLHLDQPKLDRLESLEKFIKLFLVNVEGQANPEPKPPSIEDGEKIIPDKEKPKFRPSSFLSILNTAPMTRPNSRPQTRPNSRLQTRPNSRPQTRPNSRPQTRPVSSNVQENEDTPNVPSIPEAEENLNVPSNNHPPSNRLSFFLSKFPKSESPNKRKPKTLSPNDTLTTTNDLKDSPTESETDIPSSAPSKKVPNSTKLPTGLGTDISPAIPYGAPDGKSSTSKKLPTKSETDAPSKKIPESANSPVGSENDILSAIPHIGAPDNKSSTTKNLPTKSETGVPSIAPNKIISDNTHLPTGSETDISPAIPYTGAPDGKSSTSKRLPTKSETGAPNKKISDNTHLPTGSETDILPSIPYTGAPNSSKSSISKNLPTKSETGVPSSVIPNKKILESPIRPETDVSSTIPYTDSSDNKSSTTKNLPIESEVGISLITPDINENNGSSEKRKSIRKSIVYVDEQDNLLTPGEANNIRKSIIYVDEEGNPLTPEEAESVRRSVIYVDQDGNPLTPEEAENMRKSIEYIDEDGNPLTPEEAEIIRNSVVYVDEKGNPLTPEEAENVRNSVVYIDEDGNPLTPEEAEIMRNSVVYVDEKGNPLTPKEVENIRNSVIMKDNDEEIEELNQEVYVGEGSSKSVKKHNLKDSVTNQDETIPATSGSSKSTLSLPIKLKKLFKKNKK